MSKEQETIADLNDLVVNCDELRELQSLLGQFNTFRVLGIEDMGIRHSNMLAWLLTPNESHGLRDQFLRRYLMHVSNDTENDFLEPVEIDSVQIFGVEVLREWRNIDLLIDLDTSDGKWLVIIENKVNSKQHSNQLKRYREIVEQAYPDYDKFYLLLSKHREDPDDAAYVSSSYELVHRALKSCIKEFSSSIGAEPAVLLKNYLSLLEQKFMPNNKIEALAHKIYKAHKLAIDTIIENKPEIQDNISNDLQKKVDESDSLHGLSSSRTYFRFMPNEWKTAKNLAGKAWGQNSAYIILEVYLGGTKPSLKIVTGRAPYSWIETVHHATKSAPFKRGNRKLRENPVWVTIDSIAAPAKLTIKDIDPSETEEISAKVWEWISKTIQTPDFKKRIEIIKDLIQTLPEAE